MMPVSTLYDEYIDRPKLRIRLISIEQNKPIWVYSSSPLKRGRNIEVQRYVVRLQITNLVRAKKEWKT